MYKVSILSVTMSKEFVSHATQKAALEEVEGMGLIFENNSILWIIDSTQLCLLTSGKSFDFLHIWSKTVSLVDFSWVLALGSMTKTPSVVKRKNDDIESNNWLLNHISKRCTCINYIRASSCRTIGIKFDIILFFLA